MMRFSFSIIALIIVLTSPINSIAGEQGVTDFYCLFEVGRYDEAYQIAQDCKFFEDIDSTSNEYTCLLGSIGECETELDLLQNANYHLNKTLALCQTYSKQDTSLLITTLFRLALLKAYMEDESLSTSYAEQAWALAKIYYPEQSSDYCNAYINYIRLVPVDSLDESIIEYINNYENRRILQAKIVKMESELADSISQTVKLLERACQLYRDNIGNINYSEYAHLLNELGENYTQLGQYFKAFNCFSLAYSIYKKTHGTNSLNALVLLINMALVKGNEGEYEYAKILVSKATNALQNKYGSESFEYAGAMSADAVIKLWSNDVDGAIKSQKKAIEIFRVKTEKDDESYLNGLLSLSSMFSNNNQHNEAKECLDEYLVAISENYEESSIEYASGLCYLGHIITNQGQDPRSAIILLEKGLQLFEGHDENECWLDKADANELLAFLYMDYDLEKASYHIDQVLNIYNDHLHIHHTNYIGALGLKAEIEFRQGKYDLSLNRFMNYLNYRKKDISERFIGFDKQSRTEYWDKYLYPFHQSLPIEAFTLRENPNACTLFYNTLLFKKGILLNAEIVLGGNDKSSNENIDSLLLLDECNYDIDSIIVLSDSITTYYGQNNHAGKEEATFFQDITEIDYETICKVLSNNSSLKNRYMVKRLCRAAKEFIENMTN